MLFRMPDVVSSRHRALKERWSKVVWLGHARDMGETLVADAHGVRKCGQ